MVIAIHAGVMAAGPAFGATITLKVGETRQVAAEHAPDGATEPLRYESGNTGFFTVDDKGMLTGVHEGVTMLSITAANGATREFRVEVTPGTGLAAPAAAASTRGVPDEGIVIGNAGGRIKLGFHERIIAHVLPYQVIGTTPFNIETSDASVLAVNNTAKTIAALKEGTATITALTLDGQHKVSVAYTVVPRRVEPHTDETTYKLEPQQFGIRYDDASEEAAKANSAGLHRAMRHTADNGFTRLLLDADQVLYIEPKDTIHMVSNVQLDLNGSEVRLRPNNYERYVAFKFGEKDSVRLLENASIVNGTITGERDHKDQHLPNWKSIPATEGGVTIEFYEGYNNGIRNLTVRKSIGFNISSNLGSTAYGVQHYNNASVKAENMEQGGFDDAGAAVDAKGLIRTRQPINISAITTPYFTVGYPLGYMSYPFVNSRIYDVCFYDQDMKLLSMQRGWLRFRQYDLPEGAAHVHLAFYVDNVPAHGNTDFGGAFAFVENRGMPISNYMIDCIIEDNYSCGFAACGGQGWLIQNNIFRRNGGRMPGCDIDWEDGWEYMQADLIEGNTFESVNNVITCAGVGLIFRNNTFRGSTLIYGRSQHFSFMDNVFEKAEGDNAYPVKLTLNSQTDMYASGNRYTNATVTYAREHKKEPFVGTYEVFFNGEVFDNTHILTGYETRLTQCTIRNGVNFSLISAEQFDHCTIESGSYTINGMVQNTVISNAELRVSNGKNLHLSETRLTNPHFTGTSRGEELHIQNCDIVLDAGNDKVLITPNGLSSVVIRDSRITIGQASSSMTLVGGWNANDAHTTVNFERVEFKLPSTFEGYLHKFAWYADAPDKSKVIYNIVDTDMSRFRKTDEKGAASNVVFNINAR
jgi:hypothetical protein